MEDPHGTGDVIAHKRFVMKIAVANCYWIFDPRRVDDSIRNGLRDLPCQRLQERFTASLPSRLAQIPPMWAHATVDLDFLGDWRRAGRASVHSLQFPMNLQSKPTDILAAF
jgi:hypothetical protein